MSTQNQVVVTQQKKETNLQALLEANKGRIAQALPKHLTPERLLQIAMTEVRKNPALLDCTQASFIGAIIQTAQLGLEPGGALGHSYLVPFRNKDKGITEVQFIIGYRGMINLAYRSPRVSKIIARPVFNEDKFSFGFGLNEFLNHEPNQEGKGDKLTHTYVIVQLSDGTKLFDVMYAWEVEEARKRSKAADKGPWVTDFVSMALKSNVRRFFKYMPSSVEMQQAIGMDEAGDRGEQFNGIVGEAVGIPAPATVDHTDKFNQNLATQEPEAEPTQPAPDEQPQDATPFGQFRGGGFVSRGARE